MRITVESRINATPRASLPRGYLRYTSETTLKFTEGQET
jgi:hypothetical protein